jgi:predicted AlkP superfamily phosphohydrolase/phosphomutase
MKTLVIGLDCAAPELLLRLPHLPHIRSLMERGCYGSLESVVPPITVPAWMCMSTSQDPGSLGVYGFRNRKDYGYSELGVVNSKSITAPAIWDYLGRQGLRSIIVAVPPSYPPRQLNGINIGCFLTPDTKNGEYTFPAHVKKEIESVLGDEEYLVDVKFRVSDKAKLLQQIYQMSRAHFKVIRHLLCGEWDYFQFVEIGLDRVHHGFWKYHDPQHRQHEPGSEFQHAITDYYKYLDEEIGTLLELLEDDTNILIVSDHGAQRLDGGFCVNEWLCREGLLTLHEKPASPTPFKPSLVDWSRTKVWSEGGYYARVFFNVEGREPNGTIPRDQYDSFLADMEERFKALPDDRGQPMGSLVFRPGQLYKEVNNIAPDLIVHFGSLYWRSIGGVGYDQLYIQENDTGPDDCNHAQYGAFILASPGLQMRGEVEGMRLLDIAPTIMRLMGEPIPPAMQGSPLIDRVKPAVMP